ncbi:zinc-binding dehydrogenase [Blautia schinkii]|nr:zinc-binding dehydrogenase [Blautia schinkii]
MKSLAVTKDHRLEIVEVPVPEIDSSSFLIQNLACGICSGTDTKILHGKFKGVTKYPALLGHEAVGRVIKCGKDVEQFKEGDLVISANIPMSVGGYESAWGGYSEYLVGRDWKAMARNGSGPFTPGFEESIYTQMTLPQDFDPVKSTMIVTLREVLAAALHFGFQCGKSLAVFGAGPVGLTFIKFAKLLGVSPIIAFDILPEKLEEATAAGADFVYNSKGIAPGTAVRSICPRGVDFVLDAVGVNEIINQGLTVVKDGGEILVYGISPEMRTDIDWSLAPYNWKLQFLHMPIKPKEAAAHHMIINWIHMGLINLDDYISHVFAFDDILSAFEIVEKHLPCKKIVIKYEP